MLRKHHDSGDGTISLSGSSSIKLKHLPQFQRFLQRMVNRIYLGNVQYEVEHGGVPHRSRKYLRRLKLELSAYERTRNIEHLLNIANYAYLESMAPEVPVIDDCYVDSATRGRTLTGEW